MEGISDRSANLLKKLIERYLKEGQPVGSKTLAAEDSIELSSATIRNIMSDLEDKGLLSSPHTSAGRVPTPQGLRFFVDSLLTMDPMAAKDVETVREQLSPKASTENLIETTSSLLSEFTQLVGIVSTPRHDHQLLRRVEFLPLTGQRVLVILVINEEEVQNRIIQTDRSYSESELEQAANYLNSIYLGKDLFEIRKKLLDLLQSERENLNCLMKTAIDVADKAFQHQMVKQDYILAGESKLLTYAKPIAGHQLRKLFEAFEEKQSILHLLDECIKANGIQIYIGEEASDRGFEGCSMITSPYCIDGRIVGAVGVIGPTRMPYQRVIPLVDVTAKLLSSALNQTI